MISVHNKKLVYPMTLAVVFIGGGLFYYSNQPFPNTCSIIVRPSQTTEKATLDFGF